MAADVNVTRQIEAKVSTNSSLQDLIDGLTLLKDRPNIGPDMQVLRMSGGDTQYRLELRKPD